MVENLESAGRNLESMDNPMALSAISKSLSNVSVNITINIATIGNPPVERVLSGIVMMISSYAETATRLVASSSWSLCKMSETLKTLQVKQRMASRVMPRVALLMGSMLKSRLGSCRF